MVFGLVSAAIIIVCFYFTTSGMSSTSSADDIRQLGGKNYIQFVPTEVRLEDEVHFQKAEHF